MSDRPSPSSNTLTALEQLIAVVAQLRNPDGGCPWDLEQTPESLIPYIIEEAYESVDAIRRGDSEHISEELGDLLLQVVLQAQIAQEAGDFSLAEVAQGITDKLIRRHPHVFADTEANTSEEVRQNWQAIKAAEKGDDETKLSSKLARYARTLPPLRASQKISEKAAEVGFEWEKVEDVWTKFDEELGEFKEAIAQESRQRQEEELGDLLFVLVNLARWYDLDPEAALQGTHDRFLARFTQVEAACDRPLSDYSVEELEALWQIAKQRLTP
ncbi:MAG: nucleoside triphosphate pyrophosphohydrolase [Phormidium sp. GEM2.Bin31]|nr:MAG: nucleoside triphosphate pyrophosphohydrolase [Phormidium sp. GEM2.Bin31]